MWRVHGNYITNDRDDALMENEAELLAEAERARGYIDGYTG